MCLGLPSWYLPLSYPVTPSFLENLDHPSAVDDQGAARNCSCQCPRLSFPVRFRDRAQHSSNCFGFALLLQFTVVSWRMQQGNAVLFPGRFCRSCPMELEVHRDLSAVIFNMANKCLVLHALVLGDAYCQWGCGTHALFSWSPCLGTRCLVRETPPRAHVSTVALG